MNDNVDPNAAPVTPPQVDTSSSHIDPGEHQALLERNAVLEATFDRLNPLAPRIKKMLDDPAYVKMLEDQDAAYEAVRQRHEPQVDPSLKPVYDRLSKIEEVANSYLEDRRAQAEAPQREFKNRWESWQNDRKNEAFYRRLTAENPDLKRRDFQYLAQVAAEQDFAPLENVWKQEEWRFVKGEREAPPPSLRTDAGDVGIPGSSTKRGEPPTTVYDRVVQLERARRRIA